MTGLIHKSFSKGVKSHLNLDPLSNTILRVCGYLHIHVLFNNYITLEDELLMYSPLPIVNSSRSKIGTTNISKQTCRWFDHCHVGETDITLDGSASRMLLSYRLCLWKNKVYMHLIPRFYFCVVIGC